MPVATVLSLLKAGRLQPTDQVAHIPAGPWMSLQQACRQSEPSIVVVETFKVRRTLFGGAFVATYECPQCRALLQSTEDEWGQIESCPTCGLQFRISPSARRTVTEQRDAETREKKEAAAAAQAARERKEASRRAALEQKQRDLRAAADEERQREVAFHAEERARVREAMATRMKADACWYCGAPSINSVPQCVACRMVPQ